MLKAERFEKNGRWPRDGARGSVTLTYEERHRRRALLRADDGVELLLDLPRAVLLEEGDGLALADGGWIAVRAAPEPLLEIRAPTPVLLARLVWHLGNRHLPAQIEADRIVIREDHVIAVMLEGLGASLSSVQEVFRPEAGAYAGDGHAHGGHAHD
jgi:urease accessory protein